ncbi:ribosomal protein S18-alanine N-acetyltransferase [Virgibacillus salexigens]|uniref:[Ribosomal protein bS18]-alanine N-acetyltransferase n=1 Tax=Virgibacillus massiliensis TaxID=1462526 RepID=A0A024QGZ7_9BACI|nr:MULTISPECIES: ribosomal protein S18-alanine N-acetyltransferase [Virgibacillus]MYL43583.1 ribosomal-protein-alanine N-acetyltransferase [Virgibacillus massiliensis]CDQ41455.1 ribosomal-protein-alanine N-acetyltransferase [Virgibacillus massiliensis]
MIEPVIRRMEIMDIDAVIEVERTSFSTSWTKDIFYQEISDNPYAHYFVMELDKKIIGYIGTWIVLDDAQITNLAIQPIYRGKSLGEKLFHYTMQYAIIRGVSRLSLEVRESNTIAQNLYQKFGLVPGGLRKNYYTDNQEDAIVMWVNLS